VYHIDRHLILDGIPSEVNMAQDKPIHGAHWTCFSCWKPIQRARISRNEEGDVTLVQCEECYNKGEKSNPITKEDFGHGV
jgi:hypothetical protein